MIINARWYRNSPYSWILKTPARDGGVVLAIIAERESGEYYRWQLGANVDVAPIHISLTFRGACHAARRALRAHVEAR